MNLGKMKTLAIAVLLVMNIAFLAALLGRFHAASTYDGELIDSAVASYKESGIIVDTKLLRGKIPSFPVYAGEMAPMAEKLRGIAFSSGMTLERTSAGTRLTSAKETLFFGDDFSFSFTSDERTELPSVLYASGFYPLQSHYIVNDEMEKTVFAFLREKNLLATAEKAGYTLSFDACYGSGGDHLVCVKELFNGMDTSFTLYFLVSRGRVLSADGSLCLLMPEKKMTADNVGPIQILFAEKNRMDASFAENGERSEKVLSDIKYSYTVYFDTDGSFYFVPMLILSYKDGTESRYNYVNGKEYLR